MSYYKITTHNNRSLTSIYEGVQYREQYWAHPSLGKLFVFDSFTNALKYCVGKVTGKIEFPIWKCEVKDPEILAVMSYHIDQYKRFWESFPHLSKDLYVEQTPEGTIACSAVRLLERIC